MTNNLKDILSLQSVDRYKYQSIGMLHWEGDGYDTLTARFMIISDGENNVTKPFWKS